MTAYNPVKDADGSGAKLIVDLLAGVLEQRLEALKSAAEPAVSRASKQVAEEERSQSTVASTDETTAAAVAPGQAWSSDPIEETSEQPETPAESSDGKFQDSAESEDSHSQ